MNKRCGAFAEIGEQVGHPKGWPGCTRFEGHPFDHRMGDTVLGPEYALALAEHQRLAEQEKEMPTEDAFRRYVFVQREGKFNMMTQVTEAMDAAGLSYDIYALVQQHYEALSARYPEVAALAATKRAEA